MAKDLTLNSIDAKIDRLSAKVDRLIKINQAKEVWVSGSWIVELTGWNPNRMRAAREQNILQYRTNANNGIEYLLSSLPEVFIKKTGS